MIDDPAKSMLDYRKTTGRVLDQVDQMRSEIVELEQSLIRFDSVNQPPWGNEGPCQAYVATAMRDMGLTVDRFCPHEVPDIDQHPTYLHGRDYTDRPNVVGLLPGRSGGRSLHLAAHADVVPAGDRAQWTVDPFGALVKDGYIYGRGAVDDRDGLTGMLAALRAIQRAGLRLGGDLILTSYVDEEYAGGNGLLAVVCKGYRGDAAISCDGVGLTLWTANTGGGPFRVLIQSRVMASHPTPAMRRVQAACKEALAALSQRWCELWAHHPLYPVGTPWIMKKEPILIREWEEGLQSWDWVKYGMVCGISGYATILPGQERLRTQGEIVAALEQAYADCAAPDVYPPRVEWVYRYMDPSQVAATEPIVSTLSRSLERVTGHKPQVCGGPRHDAYMLIAYGGVPTVACGAGDVMHGRGTAHEPDERIDIDGELIPYVKALALAILDWCGCSD